jgi:hypothetical protein
MARKGTAPLILTMLIAVTVGPTGAARAEDCLAGPNAQSPQGKHWYYRIDRATKRKCWYLGDLNRSRIGAKQTNRTRRNVAPSEPVDEEAAAPAPAREAAADPGVGTRWPEAAPPAAIVAGPRAEPTRVASETPVPAAPGSKSPGVAARPVPTERVRNDPAPAKPVEPAKPPAAAAAAAAPASAARSGLPAALLGIALLLAVVGTMLVLTRRRLSVAPGFQRARNRYQPAAVPSAGPRRSLREILAQAELADGPNEREARYPGSPHSPPGHFVPGVVRATDFAAEAADPYSSTPQAREDTRDIAAATLQPAIAPLPPEPIEPAPDVEQSLRQLLDAWERRAA